MQYIAKLWLSDKKYLAVLDKALVIVTVDSNKNPVRWAIFEGEGSPNKDELVELLKKMKEAQTV